MKKNRKFVLIGIITSITLAIVFVSTNIALAQTYTQISTTGSLKVGSRNESVRTLQKFLASNTDIYPSKGITGYYGALTKGAVGQFQLAYGLTEDGVAGPKTITKLNSIISIGNGLDMTAPIISNLTVTPSGRTVTISLTSSKPVTTTVYYDTNKLELDEADTAYGTPTISGTQNVDSTLNTTKQITINNLSSNSTYYYTVMVTDANGNISLIWPTTFMTSQ